MSGDSAAGTGPAAASDARGAGGPRVPDPDVALRLEPFAGPTAGGLVDISLTGVDLTGADLTGTVLDEVQVEASSLDRLRGAGGRWRHTVLVDCRLDGADLANLRAEDVSLVRCALREARLTGAQLPGARLRAVRLEGVRASLTSWRGATFQHVVLRGCDLTEADLTGAALTDVLLEDCDLTGAQLSKLRCERVHLRGCRLRGVGGVDGLRGASVSEADAYELLPALARAAGVRISESGPWGR
ncbi:pentapeptide repeat-containing protein [Georgenia daeguensis]|uniref:Pentapeptide repeat-containing protein n=1 Tax=Georgenia daeguensis TaxID=908355 RepID=A0ABP8ETS8_9MICO